MPTTNPPTTWATRLEGFVLVAIVLLVGLAAGAASFTHVHDWTMANSPQGTPDWFGWANAIISELVPVAALLTIRRRKRTGGPIRYPMTLLIAFAGFSLAAQLGVAVGEVGPSGWLLSAVPALAFMALVKLVLAPVKTTTEDTAPVDQPSAPGVGDAVSTDTSWRTSTDSDDTPAPPPAATDPAPATTPGIIIEAPALTPVVIPRPEAPTHLIPTARFAIGQHEQRTGRAITADELAGFLSVTPDIARELLHTVTGHTSATVNGTPVGGAR